MKSACYVLVVDDDYPMRKVLDRQLTSLGCQVDLARDGHEGLALWRRNRYDLVLTDYSMPGLSGAELASRIRGSARRGSREVPLIAITGHRDDAIRAEGQEFSAFLHKPFSLSELERVIKRCCLSSGRDSDGGKATAEQTLSAEVMHSITRVFIDTMPEYVEAIEGACRAGSRQGLADASHRLKSTARLVGGTEVADLCEALEAASRSAEMNKLAEMSAAVCAAAEKLKKDLQTALAPAGNAE